MCARRRLTENILVACTKATEADHYNVFINISYCRSALVRDLHRPKMESVLKIAAE